MSKDNKYGEHIELRGELYDVWKKARSIKVRTKTLENTLFEYRITMKNVYEQILSIREKTGRTGPDASNWRKTLKKQWASEDLHADLLLALEYLFEARFKRQMTDEERTELLVKLSCRKVS